MGFNLLVCTHNAMLCSWTSDCACLWSFSPIFFLLLKPVLTSTSSSVQMSGGGKAYKHSKTESIWTEYSTNEYGAYHWELKPQCLLVIILLGNCFSMGGTGSQSRVLAISLGDGTNGGVCFTRVTSICFLASWWRCPPLIRVFTCRCQVRSWTIITTARFDCYDCLPSLA